MLLASRGLEFGEIQADQIMAPRRDVAAIDADSSMDEVLAITGEHPHRRYPVYESDLDHVIGLLDTKDLMRVVREGGEDWRSVIGPVVAIPESVSLEVAVTEMRAQGANLVVLIDEHGGTSGILSGDDVLARLLGQWHAGTRQQAGERVRSLPNGNLLLDGLALVSDLEDMAEIELKGGGDDFDTVSGFVMERLGRIPAVGERFEEAGFEFQVTAMDGRRVARVVARRGVPAERGLAGGERGPESGEGGPQEAQRTRLGASHGLSDDESGQRNDGPVDGVDDEVVRRHDDGEEHEDGPHDTAKHDPGMVASHPGEGAAEEHRPAEVEAGHGRIGIHEGLGLLRLVPDTVEDGHGIDVTGEGDEAGRSDGVERVDHDADRARGEEGCAHQAVG